MDQLAVCYDLIDIKGYRKWATPFVVYGMNAIAAFFLSSAFARVMNLIKLDDGGERIALKTYIFRHFYLSWAAPINASLAFAITYVLFFLGVMWLFYRKQIFIKL